MAKVELLTDWRGRHAGATLTLTTGAAQVLINRNKARLIQANGDQDESSNDSQQSGNSKAGKKSQRKKA